jgi:hypothetical protein
MSMKMTVSSSVSEEVLLYYLFASQGNKFETDTKHECFWPKRNLTENIQEGLPSLSYLSWTNY